MNILRIFLFSFLYLMFGVSPLIAEMSSQLGVGYGMQFRDNHNLEQYEVFWRQPLSSKTTLGDTWSVSTDIELAAALIRETNSENDGTGRFSIMPQIIFSPQNVVNFIIGLGTGFMVGETEFTDHNLGGTFLLNSKLGVQLLLDEHWGLEYVYYHQSNAGIYNYNASLNMHQLVFVYNF